MAEFKIKEGTDVIEGIRLAFNAAMYRNLFRKHNGSIHHENKVNAELKLDKWFKENIEGVPQEEKENKL